MSNEDSRPQRVQVLIHSQLERPPVPDRPMARPRLLAQLSGCAGQRVTLISAPAGYGNTLLALRCLEPWALLRRFTVSLMDHLQADRNRSSNARQIRSVIERT